MYLRVLFCFLITIFVQDLFSQTQSQADDENKPKKSLRAKKDDRPKANISQYKMFNLEKDTIFADTSLTIKDDYEYNYLRKDNFGLLAFPNEGQTYATLFFGLNKFSAYPKMGLIAKQMASIEKEDVLYYEVPTPFTDVYFKTVMQQGQNLDAFLTVNTSKNFNFSIAYKGLRSLGFYFNQLSSTGNLRLTTSYHTKNRRYILNAHIIGIDFLNQENGGIINIQDFIDGNANFDQRQRFSVYTPDADSFLKGARYFFSHSFNLFKNPKKNTILLNHEFTYENRFFEYSQDNVFTTINSESFSRYGNAWVTNNLKDQLRYNTLQNKFGINFSNQTLGNVKGYIEQYRYNYFYNRIIINDDTIIPNSLNDNIINIGGSYDYFKGKWKAKTLFTRSITQQDLSHLEAQISYTHNKETQFQAKVQNISKLPNLNFNLFQSNFENYNWVNNFKNEKINLLEATANTPWLNAQMQIIAITDHLYFSNDASNDQANQWLVSPKQYDKTIGYFSLKLQKEFTYKKFALDNTILYQQVTQDDPILNVPKITLRNTLYFSDYLFKKALFLQTGVTFNYFTKYYASEYNPIIGEFFVQNQSEIGNFPMLDFFVNARIKQTRIFIKAEHFNSSFTGNNFFVSPSQPYRDFIIRFGLVWNFFQ